MVPDRPTVVSAIYGDSDTLKPLPEGTTGHMFTDRLEVDSGGWEIHHEPMNHLGHPRLKAKFWKVLVHLAVPDPLTLWIDGSMQLLPGWESIAEEIGPDDDAVFFKHHVRDCVYEEVPASFSGRPLSYEGQNLYEQVEHYAQLGLPRHAGLIASGCSLRRNTPEARDFNHRWWLEICRWSIQDQLSATPAIQASAMNWHYFSRWMTDQPWFDLHRHTGGDTGEAG